MDDFKINPVSLIILISAICIGSTFLGFKMGKAPWVEAGTLKCEYTFPTLETTLN